MAPEKKVVISGEPRADLDARAMARILIRLALWWQTQAEETGSSTGSASVPNRKDVS
jgi:hypothetical protein